jgi:lambda repressor-like predicted transcriptional regulator
MHPEEIKAALRIQGWTLSKVADIEGVAKSTVSQVVSGSHKSARIQAFIAKKLGKTVKEIWPNQVEVRRSRLQIEIDRKGKGRA